MDKLLSFIAMLVSVITGISGNCRVGIVVDNSYEAFVDGSSVLTGSDYTKRGNVNVSTSNSVLGIAADNLQGASGILVTSEGDIYSSNATDAPVTWRCILRDDSATYMTNNQWATTTFDDSAWPIAYSIGDIDTKPWKSDKHLYAPVNNMSRWIWNHNPGYNVENDFGKPYSDGDKNVLCRGTFTLIQGCQIVADPTTEASTTTEAATTNGATTTPQGDAGTPAQAASSDSTGLGTTTIVLLALLGAFILALIIGLIIFCCCCRQGGAVAVKEKGTGIYNGRPVAHVPVTSKLGDTADNYIVESDGSTSNLVALPKDSHRNENGYYY